MAGASGQPVAKIDDRSRQNPAYRPTHILSYALRVFFVGSGLPSRKLCRNVFVVEKTNFRRTQNGPLCEDFPRLAGENVGVADKVSLPLEGKVSRFTVTDEV